jgi:hypothetical protein
MKALPLALAAVLCACAPAAVVVVSPGYDAARTQLVTVAAIEDFPGAAGSGEIVADALERRLLRSGYRVVARRRALPVLRAELGDAGGDASADQIRAAARALGVDALAFGALADYTSASDRTVMADYPQQEFAPVYGSAARTAGRQDPFPYNDDKTSWVKVPVEQITPAHIALSVELLDAETGETLWTASAERTDNDLAAATAKTVEAIMTAVAAKIRASSAAAPAASVPPPPSVPDPPALPGR